MLPNQTQWDTFYRNVQTKSGLDLFQYKPGQIQRRIMTMMETREVQTLDQFWKSLLADPNGMEWLLDKLAINVSELFRNPEKWEEMRTQILPLLLKKTSRIKAWSAGCSIGAEAHSLAVLFAEYFKGPHTIVGTDIDQAALKQARDGTYKRNEVNAMPPALRDKYFTGDDGEYTAKPEIKKFVSFKTGNLLADRFDTGFDLIMCRNVVIYFTDECKDKLYRRFFDALKPGGILFVGSTERIFGAQNIGFDQKIPFFYQKPLASNQSLGDTSWRTAS